MTDKPQKTNRDLLLRIQQLEELLLQSTKREMQWVSVDDELPGEDEDVLVCSIGGNLFMAWLDGADEWDSTDKYMDFALKQITHWAYVQLPEELIND